MIYKMKDMKDVQKLFDNIDDPMVSVCLSNIMGNVYADDQQEPKSAVATLGNFSFFAGLANKEIVSQRIALLFDRGIDFHILTPPDSQWEKVIEECFPERSKKITRYAMKKDISGFDKQRLKSLFSSPPAGYEIRRIDGELFAECLSAPWSQDLVGNYGDFTEYEKLGGMGFVAIKDDQIAAGASAYASGPGYLEIEIDTKMEHRRKGLAYACGSRLIYECLENGIYPNWDAHNPESAHLAQQLGYQFSHTYTAYEVM